MITKSTLFWLAMSTIPMMPLAKWIAGDAGVYLMCMFGIIFITLWLICPKKGTE